MDIFKTKPLILVASYSRNQRPLYRPILDINPISMKHRIVKQSCSSLIVCHRCVCSAYQVERLPEPDSSEWVAMPSLALDEAAASLLVTNSFPEQPMPAPMPAQPAQPAQVEAQDGQMPQGEVAVDLHAVPPGSREIEHQNSSVVVFFFFMLFLFNHLFPLLLCWAGSTDKLAWSKSTEKKKKNNSKTPRNFPKVGAGARGARAEKNPETASSATSDARTCAGHGLEHGAHRSSC